MHFVTKSEMDTRTTPLHRLTLFVINYIYLDVSILNMLSFQYRHEIFWRPIQKIF